MQKGYLCCILLIIMVMNVFSGCKETTQNETSETNTLEEIELIHTDYSEINGDEYSRSLFYKNSYKVPLGDPTILPVEKEDGLWYYVTGTKSGKDFRMWRTKNFADWEDVGVVYAPPSDSFGAKDFWAPQLMFDPDADRRYYLGDSASEGNGLYLLCFSARDVNGVCQVSVAFSEEIEGPYKHFEDENVDGDRFDPSTPLFRIEKIKNMGLYADHTYGDLYKENRSFIDACPYIDPVTGDKYFYMVRSRNVDSSNDIWGMKMKDWVTPDYSTLRPLAAYGYTTVEKEEEHKFYTKNNIDEGPFVYYMDPSDDGIDNGKYYLTFSIGDTNDKLYPVCQAIGDSPLGPFTKIQPEDGGLLTCPQKKVDIHGCGHHAFFEVGGELYVAYHTYEIIDTRKIGTRYFGFDKVEWMYNQKGQYIMHSNGPTKSIQPLPSATSGFENIAPLASVSVTNAANASDAQLLNDKLIAQSGKDLAKEFSTVEDTVIELNFNEYVTAKAIMIYNSHDFRKAFSKVDRIELYYSKEIDGKAYQGVAVINDLGFDLEANTVPAAYVRFSGELTQEQLRPTSASVAEFDEIKINRIKIFISVPEGRECVNVSEIVVLGKKDS